VELNINVQEQQIIIIALNLLVLSKEVQIPVTHSDEEALSNCINSPFSVKNKRIYLFMGCPGGGEFR